MKTSVALCTYNGEDYIEKQLISILQQSRVPNEIVIVDDCSTDNTMNIIRHFARENKELEITILQNETTLRTIKNFEKAISLCKYDWVFLCDQDDIWKKNKIEVMLRFIENNNDTLMLFTNASLIDENDQLLEGTIWDKWNFTKENQNDWKNNDFAFQNLVRNKNYVTGATAVISNKLFSKALPIIVPPRYYHDCWFALFASAHNGLYFIPDLLTEYRIHPKQQIGDAAAGKNIKNVLIDTGITQEEFTTKMIDILNKKEVETFRKKIVKFLKTLKK